MGRPTKVAKPKTAASNAAAPPAFVASAAPHNLADLSAVVINLRSRPDRWKRISKALAKRAPWLPAERLEAVDGRVDPPSESDVTRRWSTADIAAFCDWYYVKQLTMSPGERGCCASHVKCWQLCARRRKPLVVLEDDAVLWDRSGVQFPELCSRLIRAVEQLYDVETEPVMLYVGCEVTQWRDSRRVVVEGPPVMKLREAEYLWQTSSYILWPAAAKELLSALDLEAPYEESPPPNVPFDLEQIHFVLELLLSALRHHK